MKKILVAFLLLAGIAAAQTYGSFSGVVTGPTGIPVANASVTICHAGAVIIGTDCAQKATIYSSSTGGTLANPLTTNANGEFTFYAPPGDYTYSWNGNLYRASVTMAGNPVVAGLTIGSGPAMTQAPVMTWTVWIPVTGESDNGNFWPPTGITIQRILATFQTAPICTVAPVLFVTDGIHSTSINITGGYNDSGVISYAFSSTSLTINTSAGNCTTFPTDGMVTVQYRMQ